MKQFVPPCGMFYTLRYRDTHVLYWDTSLLRLLGSRWRGDAGRSQPLLRGCNPSPDSRLRGRRRSHHQWQRHSHAHFAGMSSKESSGLNISFALLAFDRIFWRGEYFAIMYYVLLGTRKLEPQGLSIFQPETLNAIFCNILVQKLLEICIIPLKKIYDSKSSLIEHIYRYYIHAVQITWQLVGKSALIFLKFQPTMCFCLPKVHCDSPFLRWSQIYTPGSLNQLRGLQEEYLTIWIIQRAHKKLK